MQPYVKNATKQLTPAFNQQRTAILSQVPAIQQLYDVLNKGLLSQGKAQKQDIYEQSSARGLLRSTIPVQLQTALSGALTQQQGELGARQAQEIAGVNKEVGSLGVSQTSAIAQLAQALASRALADRQLKLQQRESNRAFNLQKQLADREYQLQLRGGY